MSTGWLYDGETAIRRVVEIEADGAVLRVTPADAASSIVDPGALVHVESRAFCEVYGRDGVPGWRLGIPAPAPDELSHLLPAPHVYGGWIDRIGLARALLAGAAVSAAVLLAAQQLPDWLAPLVPASWERSFGDALVGDLGQQFCGGAGGQDALDGLTARLSPTAGPLKVRVVDIGLVNAAALPGGNIVIFRGLLAEADSPDEVAGVLAHEIAHVKNRDVTRALIRHLGLGMIVASFGGTTGANVETLMAARYSREAESTADRDAIVSLRRANISPLPTAAFFDRIAKTEGKLGAISGTLQYLSSHPLSAGRQSRFRSAARPGLYAPSLKPDEWAALQDICRKGAGQNQPES